MEPKKIIIISASEQRKRFFKLEALNFDFSVECLEKLGRAHSDLSAYDLAIIDKDTIKQMPLNSAKKQITVSSDEANADIGYPCSITKLRNIYNGLCAQPKAIENQAEKKQVKIIFYKNEKNLISVNKKKYILSDTEYKILTALCKNANEIITREEIQGILDNESSNIGDVYICKLRKRIEEPLGQKLIFTVRQKGYKIVIGSEWR